MSNMQLARIAAKIDSLNLWDVVGRHHWVIKPKGTAFPYFFVLMKDGRPDIRWHMMLLEGWKTFHDYVHTLADNDFGYFTSPADFAHFEVVFLNNKNLPKAMFFRHDPCYVPRFLEKNEEVLFARILWEVYGVMMRIESDSTLSMKYASEHAMFARIEGPDGVWNDAAMPIPPPQQHVEQIVLASALLNSVKDMPFTQDMRVAIDYHMNVMKMTKEARPRYPYVFRMIDANTRELLCEKEYLSNPEDGLRGIWEHLPQLVLEGLKLIGKVPGEVITPSGRVFRLVRPLCNEIPFKLTCDAGTDVWK